LPSPGELARVEEEAHNPSITIRGYRENRHSAKIVANAINKVENTLGFGHGDWFAHDMGLKASRDKCYAIARYTGI
jgi:hypothetical protein